MPISSKSEDVDAVEQALGQLAPLKDHAALCGLTPASLRDLVKRGLGPPLFRRPASHHLIGYLGQTRALAGTQPRQAGRALCPHARPIEEARAC